jgi:hypothetical protein
MTAIDPGDLVRRYVAVWHEPDAEMRRKAVHELWAEDGAQVLQPPEEMRRAAAGLGFPSLVLRARGHEELEARVTRTYHEFIASGQYTFRSRANADRLGDVVKFNWEMIPAGGGEAAGAAWRSSSWTPTTASRPITSSSKADAKGRAVTPWRR